MLRDVQGSAPRHHGTLQKQRANIDFQVADISDSILSLVKLLRNGLVFRLNGVNDSIMYHRIEPTTTVP